MEIDEQYLRDLLAQRTPAKKRGSPFDLLFLLAVVGSLLFALAVKGPELLVTYGVVPVEQMCAWLNVECPELTEGQQAQPTAPTAKAITVTTFGGGGGGGGAPRTNLPDCSTVTDTTTACINTGSTAPEQAREQPTPTLELAPAAIECWQGSFYTCDELAEMGEQKAIEAVREADTFVDIQTLPTPAPAFVEYATDACAAAAVKSPLCP